MGSMCAVDEVYIYVTGGLNDAKDESEKRCYRYFIDGKVWQNVPNMHQARMGHSSCQLQGYLYVFCGIGNFDEALNSVEKLAIVEGPDLQKPKEWELIPESNLLRLP